MILLLFLYNMFKKKSILYIPIFLLSFIVCVCYNCTENYFSHSYYDFLNYDYGISTNYRVSNLISDDLININSGNLIPSIYSSTINKYYSNLYHNVFHINNNSINNLMINSSSNALFNRYMGIRYIYSGYDLGFPYKRVSSNLYELSSLPIGYVNSKCVNEDYFNSLEYPYNIDILMNYVVSSDCDNMPISGVSEIDLDYSYKLGFNSYISDGMLYVSDDDTIRVNINNDLSNKLLFINVFGQVEQDNDKIMSINGQSNLLTHKGWLYSNGNNDFYYLIGGSNVLDINVSKGIYNISNIKTYVMDYSFDNSYDEFNVDIINSEKITGNINVREDGMFILKIPYDKGFKIIVDGSKIDYSLVNDSFIGFYLEKGDHDISINYVSPGLKLGKVISSIGFVCFGLVIFLERRKSSEN